MHRPSSQEPAPNVEMNRLREQLLGHGTPTASASSYPPVPPSTSGPDHPYRGSGSTSPRAADQSPVARHNSTQMSYSMSNDSGAEDAGSDRAKGKRELSTSKRAAQNRAAQRAFRQRKESYIKKLEEQVKDFKSMESNYRSLQDENYQLREYVLNLQSRLLETQSDVPPPPLQINLPASTTIRPSDADRGTRREPAQLESRQGLPESSIRSHAPHEYGSPQPSTTKRSP